MLTLSAVVGIMFDMFSIYSHVFLISFFFFFIFFQVNDKDEPLMAEEFSF